MTQVVTPANANGKPAVSPEAAQEALIQSAILEISHIATLPEITLKIIRLVEDPDSTAQDLNKIISNDPALGARVLKVVNSAFYGLPGQIGSINRAIVLLGLNAVKNIAIAASLTKLFRGGQVCPTFNAKDLWTHSIAVGTGTRLLAKKVNLGLPDEAFLAGLIHDLGIMVEMQARRAKFTETMEKLDAGQGSVTLRQAELAVIGATHEQFGAALCKAWKFPLSFAYVTGFHHRPLELAESNRTLTALVHIADILASNLQLGYSRTVESQTVSDELLASLNLTPAMLDEVKVALPPAMAEATTLLSDGI
ncbi:MAG: HDOD domain-containing protein [Planctomycetota bacterium]|nr:HDOD domain-containing protein [Planctomycetota bacterium]